MSVNPLARIWHGGGVAVGTFIMYSRDVATIEIAAAAGLDFVLFDLEHRPHDTQTIHDLSQVARLAGMAALVGPREISTHAISHVLDLGASGVVIPHVQTVQDVAVAVEAVRYPPRGRRGRCGMAGHNLYNPRPSADELAEYNDDVALLLKVESEAAIGDLEQLVASDDVNGVIVGPADLALDMGIPGQANHPRIVALIDRVRAVCKEQKICYGTHVASAADVPRAIAQGATWVIVSSEMELLAAAWQQAARSRTH